MEGGEGAEAVAQTSRAITASPPASAFVILARHGVSFRDRATISGGHVGVRPSGTGTPNTMTTGINSHVTIGRELMAESVSFGAGSVVGNIDANIIAATGSTTGAQSPYVAPPVPPLPGAAAPGTTAVTVNSGQTRTLAAGAFGAVSVNGTLNLSGGTYNFRSLTVNNDARVVALAGSVVRLSTGVTALDRSHLIVAAGLHSDSLRIEASGTVDANATGASLTNDVELRAFVVTQNAFRAGDRLVASGVIAAQDVVVGFDAQLTFDTGFLACSTNAGCNDGNSCTVDSCVAGRCQNTQTNTCAVAVTAGWFHSCALEADGRVFCWGQNGVGQLGDGTTALLRTVPTLVPGVTDAVAVKAGGWNTCVLRAGGGVLCWGANGLGEVGDGTTVTRIGPAAVPLPRRAISIAIQGSDNDLTAHACAVLDDHSVWCWGGNNYGSLGDGTTTNRLSPVPVVGLNNAVNVSCSFGTTCAALSSGSVSCWGFNEHGDLGIGSELPNQSNVPVTVVGVSNAALVDLGFDEMILTRTGSALAWGSNGFGGRVGDGTTIDRFAPVAVLNATDVTATGMGLGHACIVHSPGTASCWGDNSSGELGNGTLTTSSAPVNVVGLTNVKGIAAGSLHTCAVKTDGSVWCWGQNVGDLGDGNVNFVNQSTPIRAQL
jgi:alpha-tubulin suppressor-like RCC1 family protein